MLIGVDAREIQDGIVTGIGRPLANFIEYFECHEEEHTLFLFAEKRIPTDFTGNVRTVIIGTCPTFLWDQWKLPRALRTHNIDLLYSPYYKIPLLTGIPVISQILDVMYLIFPPYRKALGVFGRLYYAIFGRAFSRRAIRIITDSEHAKQDIMNLWKVNADKIVVIPLGLAGRYAPVKDKELLSRVRESLGLPDKYLLYLGNFKPHKNVESLIKAFSCIEGEIPECMLVLAGPLDANGLRVRELATKQGIAERVFFTDTIREDDRPEALLTMAELFIFPTLYEGFGLPPLEAMACGTPVIASNLTAVPEVVGEASVMIDPLNVEELGHAIISLLADPVKMKRYSRMGLERAKQFREENTAGSVYRHILAMLEKIG